MANNELYFILSSHCKLVSGAKRSLIINYGRGDIYFISEAYSNLLNEMDREKLSEIEQSLYDDESKANFDEFLSVLITHEIGFLTAYPERFPLRSDTVDDDAITPLIDIIIGIDSSDFDFDAFAGLCEDLKVLRCKDFQLRCFPVFDQGVLAKVMEMIGSTCANYVEIHCNYFDGAQQELHRFVDRHALVGQVFVYGAPEAREVLTINDMPDHYPLSLGRVVYLNYPFNDGDCCGILSQETLDFSSIDTHNRLKQRNGCLDRKLSIDKWGNIRNCPSMVKTFGNIKNVSIKDILVKEDFRKVWFLHKDQISICNVCEFRYNCTDCRAFLQDPGDQYSKPLKCGYDPYTGRWEDWSVNPLKKKIGYLF